MRGAGIGGRKTMLALLLLLVGVLAYIYGQKHFQIVGAFLLSGNIAGGIDYIRSFGPYAEAAVFLIIVIINALVVVPNIVMLAAAGALFGIVEGTLIAWLAETVGVTISFLLMRYFLRDEARQVIEKHGFLHRLDEFSGQNGFRLTLMARCVPYVPSGLITSLAALSRVGFKDHFVATLIGKLPSALLEVTVGHDLLSFRQHLVRLLILVVISVLAYFWFGRKGKQ